MKCYACGKDVRTTRYAYTADDGQQQQPVGPDCYRAISHFGKSGYQPPRGGPRLYVRQEDARAADGIQEQGPGGGEQR